MGTYWHLTQILWLEPRSAQWTTPTFPAPLLEQLPATAPRTPNVREGPPVPHPQPLTVNSKGVLLGGSLSCVRARQPLKTTLGGRQPWGATHRAMKRRRAFLSGLESEVWGVSCLPTNPPGPLLHRVQTCPSPVGDR